MVKASQVLDRVLVLEMVRVTEAAAVAASKLIGRGDEKAADAAAVEAMRDALNQLDFDGTVVIGEGERDEAPMLFIGEKVGARAGHGAEDRHRARSARRHDDHRQGRRQRAGRAGHRRGGLPAQRARRLHGQARGRPRLSRGRDRPRQERRPRTSAPSPRPRASSPTRSSSACSIGPRHEELIAELRGLGCGIQLIPDGDVAGVIAVTDPETTIDLYMGSGGAPEGVLAAAALRCVGGQFQGRLLFRNDDERGRAAQVGHRGSRTGSTSSRTWPRATASSPRPASPTASLLDGVKRPRTAR